MTRYSYCTTSNQGLLFSEKPENVATQSDSWHGNWRRDFFRPDRNQLFFGATTLGNYLAKQGQTTILRLSDALDGLDWSCFEKKYSRKGRPPYSPRLMAGLVMYGLLNGSSSLRALEQLCQLDLGCMWICAGIQPDHSNIGRFVLRHQEEFEGPFFEQVAKLALKLTNSGVEELSGDGTVIQAAASRYRTIKREALDKKLAAAKAGHAAAPDDPKSNARVKKYEAADSALKSREVAKKKKSKPIASLRVSTTEPDAPFLMQKNRSYAPGYVPSVLANDARVIVGKAVDPSEEASVIGQMLNEAETIGESKIDRLMLDGNYFVESVINESLSRDFDLICQESPDSSKTNEKFRKKDFRYDEVKDVYICPQGRELTKRNRSKDGTYVQYERPGCGDCEFAHRCYSRKSGRRVVRRLAIDEYKDAMREVMQHPLAKQLYARRKVMVEPVFAYLRGPMKINRFHRKGLKNVRLEFSLVANAYNFGRILAALAASFGRPVVSALLRLIGLIGLREILLLRTLQFFRLPILATPSGFPIELGMTRKISLAYKYHFATASHAETQPVLPCFK